MDSVSRVSNSQPMHLIKKVFNITTGEWPLVANSFLYHLCLMSGYFILRPVRDEMGIRAGVENMQWLFTGTFVAMLLLVPVFAYLTGKVSRKRLIPLIYLFFALNILTFYFAFQFVASPFISAFFFIWLSVFNLFAISIFWSFNSDVFSTNQAKRLYGPIAAGGSSGAIIGPAIAALLVGRIGVNNLLLISAGFMLMATSFVLQLIKRGRSNEARPLDSAMSGSLLEGLKLIIQSALLKHISLFILLYTTLSTFLYFEQAHIISQAFSASGDRTSFFGFQDLAVNALTLFLQFFITEKVMRKFGIIFCLALVPVFTAISFFSLGISQTVYLLFGIQVLYRSLNFSIQRPAREVLFTSVSVEERYRSKNFIDTAVYRGGDAASGWLFAGLSAWVGSLQLLAFITTPLAAAWMAVGLKTGKLFKNKTSKFHEANENIITKKSA